VGMDTIEEPTVVGVKISSGIADSATTVGNPPRAPYNFQIGQAPGPGVVNPDAFGLTIQVPALTLLDDKKGELKGNSVAVSAWCQGSDMSDFAKLVRTRSRANAPPPGSGAAHSKKAGATIQPGCCLIFSPIRGAASDVKYPLRGRQMGALDHRPILQRAGTQRLWGYRM